MVTQTCKNAGVFDFEVYDDNRMLRQETKILIWFDPKNLKILKTNAGVAFLTGPLTDVKLVLNQLIHPCSIGHIGSSITYLLKQTLNELRANSSYLEARPIHRSLGELLMVNIQNPALKIYHRATGTLQVANQESLEVGTIVCLAEFILDSTQEPLCERRPIRRACVRLEHKYTDLPPLASMKEGECECDI